MSLKYISVKAGKSLKILCQTFYICTDSLLLRFEADMFTIEIQRSGIIVQVQFRKSLFFYRLYFSVLFILALNFSNGLARNIQPAVFFFLLWHHRFEFRLKSLNAGDEFGV